MESSSTASLLVNHESSENAVSKLCYLNIQGLIKNRNSKCKINFLSEMSENNKLLILTETHLKPDILDEEVQIENFNIHRCDRLDRKCGGVSIYTHNSLKISESSVLKYSNSVCELLALKIIDLNLHILCVYRPPDTTSEEFQQCLNEIRTYMEQIPSSDNILLLGDLNFPFLKWFEFDNTVIHQMKTGGTRDEQKQANALLELTDSFFINQVITNPTRENNTLDLVFTNNPEMLSNIQVEKASKQLSDHNIITAVINHEMPTVTKPQNNRKNVKLAEFSFWSDKSNWVEINNHLNSVAWNLKLNDETNVASDIDFLYDEIYKACSDSVPKKK